MDITDMSDYKMVVPESKKSTNDLRTTVKLDGNGKMKVSDYLVAFSGQTKSYCIGLADMVDSTKIMSKINQMHWSKYYSIFLNSMIEILNEYGAIPFKNGGDSVLYYFPESSIDFQHTIRNNIECSLKMVELHSWMREITQNENLPNIDYRISMDYGTVLIMNQNESSKIDMIGPPVNMCSKINHHAGKNQVVVGGDLYQIAKNFQDFKFQQVKGYSVGLKNDYPVYLVVRSNR